MLAAGYNHWIAPAIPYNDQCSKWVECFHGGGKIHPVIHEFNSQTGLYEWTKAGLPAEDRQRHLFEASTNKIGDEWIVCARTSRKGGQTAWFRTKDLFAGLGKPTYRPTPASSAPRAAYLCPDGVLRMFAPDYTSSPHKNTGTSPDQRLK